MAMAPMQTVQFKETLIKCDSVIASEAKQSMVHAKSRAYGSPRSYGTRDDGLVQCFLKNYGGLFRSSLLPLGSGISESC